MNNILVISGFDATASAGILLDCHIVKMLNFEPFAILPAFSVQNHDGVSGVVKFTAENLRIQLKNIPKNTPLTPKFAKIGLLQNIEAIEIVAEFLSQNDIFTVVDTPFISSSGVELVENLEEYVQVFRNKLLPYVEMLTPNQSEIDILGGINTIFSYGCKRILEKGGHSLTKLFSTDILHLPNGITEFTLPRVNYYENIRGTGCALSTAILCFLAKGLSIEKSIEVAKQFVYDGILNSVQVNEKTRVLKLYDKSYN